MDSFICLDAVSVGYDNKPVLKDLSLQIKEGDRVSIIGPSGCGKTTLLYMIAGILSPAKGRVTINNEPVQKSRKGTSLILQSYGLFPWKSVWDNVMLPHILEGSLDQDTKKRGHDLIEAIGLKGLENQYPSQLSGGQKQRVAIGRAWIKTPDVLLMDEPFSALDAMTRERLQATLLSLDGLTKTTSILVTHSIEEAVFMSSKIIVMNKEGAIFYVMENPSQGDLDYRDHEDYYIKCKTLRAILEEAMDEH